VFKDDDTLNQYMIDDDDEECRNENDTKTFNKEENVDYDESYDNSYYEEEEV
jgi:hypothetical protein